MATYWVDNAVGSDLTGDGSVGNPYASIAKALTITAANDIIKILPGTGTYTEGELSITDANLKIIGVGNVIINSIGFDYVFYVYSGGTVFENLIFTGFAQYPAGSGHPNTLYRYQNCTIYQKGAKYETTYICNSDSNPRLQNSTVFGIIPKRYNNSGIIWDELYHCIMIVPNDWGSGTQYNGCDYNASPSNASIRGVNGWDTATYPAPFMSDSTATPDLRFDTTATHYDKYHHTDGEGGQCVGHSGIPVICHYPKSGQYLHNLDDNNAWGAWVNDTRWYDSTAPGVDGPTDAGPALIDTDNIQVDLASVNDARSARVISDVWDMGEAIKLKRAQVVKSVEETGQIDTDGTSPYQIEVRADSASFTKTDAPGTTDLDWTATKYNDGTVEVDQTYRYWQVRVTIRLDATS